MTEGIIRGRVEVGVIKTMQKPFYLSIIFALLAMLIGGVFLWSAYKEELDEWLPAVVFEAPENYEIIETEDGMMVKNESAGISFKVPDGWIIDKQEIGIDEWIINTSSPEAKIDKSGLLVEGCGISSWIEYDKISADIVRKRIKDPERFSAGISGGYKFIKIDGYSALRILIEHPEWGKLVAIQIPIEDKIYTFDTRFLPDETGECTQMFEEFLGGILIE
ncbi:MAG: hypothetical protein U9Q96_01810 [Patescibacteria group bacterium]|nr:hypothetical protein [Patescibacteria group bacterium]